MPGGACKFSAVQAAFAPERRARAPEVQAESRALSLRNEAAHDPVVRAVLEAFPGARIEAVRELTAAEPAADSELPDGSEGRSEGEDGR